MVAREECSVQPSASSSSKATGTPAPTALLDMGEAGNGRLLVSPLLSENPQGLTDTTWAVVGHLFTLARGSY